MKRILYIQYTNPAGYPPLEHSSRILGDAGWEVLFLGTRAQGTASLRLPPHANVRVEYLNFCHAGWSQKLHYLFFCLWVLSWVIAWRPGRVYVSDPLACPVGLLVSLAPWVHVVYHEHDSPSEAATGGLQRLILRSRRRLAGRAEICILPNEVRLRRFQADTATRRPMFCVWNCPSRQEVVSQRSLAYGDFRLLYHGSIVPDRLPLAVVHALSRLPERVKLRLIGYETAGSQGYIAKLRRLAQDLGVDHRLELIGAVPLRQQMMEQSRQCDAGLALMPLRPTDANQQTMAGASNKAFDYMACGLPLVVSELPDWRATYVESGYGLACDPQDPESVSQAIQWLLDHPNETLTMGEKGRQRILKDWNYESGFLPIYHRLQA